MSPQRVLQKDVAVLFEKLVQDNSGMRVANFARLRSRCSFGEQAYALRRAKTRRQIVCATVSGCTVNILLPAQ